MRKVLVAAALAVVAVLGAALPASAHVQGFTVDSTEIKGGGATVRAQGTVTCTPGEIVRGQLNIDQPTAVSPNGRARGHFGEGTGLNCTGAAIGWTAVLTLRSGVLVPGGAVFSARLRTEIPAGGGGGRWARGQCGGRGPGCVVHPWIQNFVSHVTLT